MTVVASDLRAATERLTQLLGDRVTTARAEREHHAAGESYHPPALPDLVCFPRTTDEVSGILAISADHHIPVVPFAAGTSIEGQVNALHGGITIAMREMTNVLQVNVEDLDATVEAGVTRSALNRALKDTGLTFFIDPGADATLGGMTATRASGTTAVRYGTMRENVLGLTVVLADGAIVHTGTRARKSSAGYDLTRLFVGSEGTLGVITEVTLRLHPLPAAVSAAVCGFETIRGAVETVIETIQGGVSVARIELLDARQMEAINRFAGLEHPVRPTLFFEFHGSTEQQVADEAAFVQSLAEGHGGGHFAWAARAEDRAKLWTARHDAYYAALALRPGSKGYTTDVCVPISRLADCILETQRDNESASFPSTLVGHVGDGNFHVVYLIDADRPDEIAEAEALADRMVTRALGMGGTCTGEHGIGYGKLKYMAAEHGPAVETMRAIKRTFDPDNRMNPGKMVEL